MAQSVDLTLVIHNHQPVGNFDHVFEEACQRAYLPFLRTLLDFPAVRIGLHTSGCLWEWVDAHQPEYGQLVSELLARQQIELLGGGMYEPILPVLPERDALWQLRRLSDYLEARFGVKPAGAWIPERVWEPQMPQLLASAGLRYCLLDDYHFDGNAPAEKVATDYFRTTHANYEVDILPISKSLRYTIPFKPPQDTLDYLRDLAQRTPYTPLAVFGDDGEKFGIWPETYEWVYEQGWLRSFFQALSDNADWLQLRLPSEVLAEREPADSVYIPARSYYEMGEWTRVDPEPDNESLPGHWRNFFNKYPESRQMYERVCGLSEKLHDSQDLGHEVWDHLGRAQCNCAYWHGVFGGLYLNYLRAALTNNLLAAEKTLPAASGNQVGKLQPLRSDELSLTVHPEHGLSVSRIDYYPTLFNWADVVARRRELYHSKLVQTAMQSEDDRAEEHASIHDIVRVKEKGLERMLVTDPHPRHSFVAYFAEPDSADQFLYEPSIRDLRRGPSDWDTVANVENRDSASVEATVRLDGYAWRKSIRLNDTGAEFMLNPEGSLPRDAGQLFVEFNLTALTDSADDRYLLIDGDRSALNQAHTVETVTELALVDEWQGRRLSLTSDQPARLLCYPVYTVSSSESGFERTYQGTCIMLGFDPVSLQRIVINLWVEAN